MLPAITIFQQRYGAIRFFLAPMAGITDSSFRLLMRYMGAQAVVSELISAEGIIRQGEKTLDLMRFSDQERPIGIQLFGYKILSLVEAAKIVEDDGADFVDLNLGCPVKKVVKNGGGAAWLRDPVALGRLLKEARQAITIPLTIKIRSGWDESSVNAKEIRPLNLSINNSKQVLRVHFCEVSLCYHISGIRSHCLCEYNYGFVKRALIK